MTLSFAPLHLNVYTTQVSLDVVAEIEIKNIYMEVTFFAPYMYPM